MMGNMSIEFIPEGKAVAQPRVIQEKWGQALQAGFQVVPNVLIRAQSDLGLDPIDVVILLNLTAHWWEKKELPYISPARIATRMDVTTRTVERHLRKLEQRKFIRRCTPKRRNGVYIRHYDLQPLVERASRRALILRAQQSQFQKLEPTKDRDADQAPIF
jgi:DNA-binding transcriptional regulator YhcF (GntR family)